MRIIQDTQFHITEETAVALGKFDGVHRGHRKILSELLSSGKDGLTPVVFTFEPSAAVFFGGEGVKEISLRDDKRRIFEDLGVSILVEFPLDHDTAGIGAEDFIKKILSEQLNMKRIVCGPDVSFGYRGAGDKNMLLSFAEKYGYEVSLVEKLMIEEGEISSTLLRKALSDGDMLLAEKILGEPYRIFGTVETGRRLGRSLGMPTMNIYPDTRRCLPQNGVYVTNALFGGAVYRGLTNIGVRPTVSDEGRLSVETYLFDFDTDMYGKNITVEFLSFLRPEKKFDSLKELSAQMARDIAEAVRVV